MTVHQPKISLESLTEKELVLYHNLDNTPYGLELATQVAQKLIPPKYEGWGVFHAHRDYCGLGLFYDQEKYVLAPVYDGYGPQTPVVSCSDEQDFITWLSQESDQSMALFGDRFNNQTITKVRLRWFLETDYSPVWNDFCRYLRNSSGL